MATAERARDWIKYAMEMMMIPGKHIHTGGCLHSERPQMVVCKDLEGGSSSLASSLYFKRCDGRFKNVKGVVLKRTD